MKNEPLVWSNLNPHLLILGRLSFHDNVVTSGDTKVLLEEGLIFTTELNLDIKICYAENYLLYVFFCIIKV